MTAGLTREQAREQIARAIHDVQCVGRCEWDGAVDPWHPMRLRLADAALTVLWPVVESLRAELAHAHTVIARHVEPKRSTGSWDQRLPDRVDGNRPSDALCGDLTDFPCCSGGSGRVDETERPG